MSDEIDFPALIHDMKTFYTERLALANEKIAKLEEENADMHYTRSVEQDNIATVSLAKHRLANKCESLEKQLRTFKYCGFGFYRKAKGGNNE